MRILTEYGDKILSSVLNERIKVLVGRNCIVSGFTVTGENISSLKIEKGTAIINGAILIEDNDTEISIPSELSFEEKVFLRMDYLHRSKKATLFFTSEDKKDSSVYLTKNDGYMILAEITINKEDNKTVESILQEAKETEFLPITSAIDQIKKIEDDMVEIEKYVSDEIDSINENLSSKKEELKTETKNIIDTEKISIETQLEQFETEKISKIEELKQSAEDSKTSIKWENIVEKPSSMPASDVYSWAKQASKPSYSWNEITGKPSSMPASDVYAWAKAATKPSYTATEVGAISTNASCNKNWHWEGKTGQPPWLWGSKDATDVFLYNPSNFNVDKVDGLHAWQMGSLAEDGSFHGLSHYMYAQFNVDGDSRFRLRMEQGHGVRVDYATDAYYVQGRNLCEEVDNLKNTSVDFKTKVASAINGYLSTSLSSESANADLINYLGTQLSSNAAKVLKFDGSQEEFGEGLEKKVLTDCIAVLVINMGVQLHLSAKFANEEDRNGTYSIRKVYGNGNYTTIPEEEGDMEGTSEPLYFIIADRPFNLTIKKPSGATFKYKKLIYYE